jgi:hypothetical protein
LATKLWRKFDPINQELARVRVKSRLDSST